MGEGELGMPASGMTGRRLSRRSVVRLGLVMASLPILAACGGAAAPAAKPTEAPKPAAPAAAKPTEAPKPAGGAAPAPSPAPGGGSPAPSPAPGGGSPAPKPAAQAAPGASSGRTAPPAPTFNKVKIDGKLSVIIDADFHPDHNVFIEKKVREFAAMMDYPLDFSTVAAFTGAANIAQKLTAAVQSGDPPDVLTHTEATSTLRFLDVLEDVDEVQNQIIKDFGEVFPAGKVLSHVDGKYYAVNHFSRAGGYFFRENAFKAVGLDPRTFSDFDKLLDGLVKASDPAKELYGWGMTANRSGDGESIVKNHVLLWGGQLCDETGQLVVLNKDPYRQYAIAGLEYLKKIYTDPALAKILPPGVNAWTDPSNNEAYLAGKLIYTNNAGTMFAKAVFDNNPVKDDTYLVMPPKGLGPGGRVLAGGGAAKRWFVIKGAKNREAANQLIRYMHSAEIQKEMFRISNGYVYPAYEWGWTEPEITASDAGKKITDVWKQYLTHESKYTGVGSYPAAPNSWVQSLESSNFWTDMFGEVLGGKPAADAVKSAHDRAIRVFKEFGAKGE